MLIGNVGKEPEVRYYDSEQVCAMFSLDNKCYEGVGVEPDIEVDFDVDLFYSTGYDTQLERALQYIETGN